MSAGSSSDLERTTSDSIASRPRGPTTRAARLGVVLLGIVTLQFILFGPSLLGLRILLPLDLLASPGVLLPPNTPAARVAPHDTSRLDLVLQFEPERHFAATELAAGRWPRWLPYQYGGVPMRFTVFSPLFLLKALTASAVVLAWAQLAVALIAGYGMYAFCRRVLRLGFWPAAMTAWCYPLSGFFVLWQGFPLADTICWFPWLLVAIHAVRARASMARVAALALVTACMILGGQLDVAALALLAAGGGAAANAVIDAWIQRSIGLPLKPLARIAAGLGLGTMLAAPYVVPYLEYARQGGRIEQRAAGHREERPPVGVAAVPLVVWPDRDGRVVDGALFFGHLNQMESAAAAYGGVIATLLVAPLAWCSRRHRRASLLCLVAIVLGVGWCANLPGWVSVLRWPGLNLLSFNRFVFISGFALLVLAAIGLDALFRGDIRPRWWFAIPVLLAIALGLDGSVRFMHLPEPLATQIAGMIKQGNQVGWVHTLGDVAQVQSWYKTSAAVTILLAALALGGWAWLVCWPSLQRNLGLAAASLMVLELLHFAYGRSAQMDRSLYYPRIPTLAAACTPGTGRVIGFFCLPANVAAMEGMSDVRGYDPVEPARYTHLLRLGADPRSDVSEYSSTQWLAPVVMTLPFGDYRVAPVFDLLGVRYVIARGTPPPRVHPDFAGDDYWGVVNHHAGPRVFVPQRVQVERDPDRLFQELGDGRFDGRAVAYVEEPVTLPSTTTGTAAITKDEATHVTITATLRTPGLLVLADRWDVGWHARVEGKPANILRVDGALRGVVLPAGNSIVEFAYAPTSFRVGSLMAGVAVLVLAVGLGIETIRRRAHLPTPAAVTS